MVCFRRMVLGIFDYGNGFGAVVQSSVNVLPYRFSKRVSPSSAWCLSLNMLSAGAVLLREIKGGPGVDYVMGVIQILLSILATKTLLTSRVNAMDAAAAGAQH